MKSILDKTFKYRPSHSTSVEKTWAEARKKIEQEKKEREDMRNKIKELPSIGRKHG